MTRWRAAHLTLHDKFEVEHISIRRHECIVGESLETNHHSLARETRWIRSIRSVHALNGERQSIRERIHQLTKWCNVVYFVLPYSDKWRWKQWLNKWSCQLVRANGWEFVFVVLMIEMFHPKKRRELLETYSQYTAKKEKAIVYNSPWSIDTLTATDINDGCSLNNPFSRSDKARNKRTRQMETTIATVRILKQILI